MYLISSFSSCSCLMRFSIAACSQGWYHWRKDATPFLQLKDVNPVYIPLIPQNIALENGEFYRAGDNEDVKIWRCTWVRHYAWAQYYMLYYVELAMRQGSSTARCTISSAKTILQQQWSLLVVQQGHTDPAVGSTVPWSGDLARSRLPTFKTIRRSDALSLD